MKTKISLLVGIMIILTSFRLMPSRTIMGKVTSADDGSALPGVNVVSKGTTTGTVTDGQGNYLISAPDQGGVLIFSFIGLQTKEVKIGTKNRIDVSLELDKKQLSEVVVVGYGENKESEPLPASNDALLGKVAGVQIRGQRSHKAKMDMAYQPSPTKQYETQEQFNTEE